MDKVQEIWLPIRGYEGLYEISNHGRVKSLPRLRRKKNGTMYWPGRIRKTSLIYGYPCLTLCELSGAIKPAKIHRLVAIHFIPNPENKREVNHKDGDKANAYVDNLEWVTPYENVIHASINGLGKSKFTLKDIADIRVACLTTNCGILSRRYGVHRNTIQAIKHRWTWKI